MDKNAIERRTVSLYDDEERVKLRDDSGDGDFGTLVGYAAVFDKLTPKMDTGFFKFREKIAPGAFTESLARNDDVRALREHDPALLLGRSSSGTLRMVEDKRGLKVEIDLPDTTNGNDTLAMIRRGDLKQMSFGFRMVEEVIEENAKTGEVLRTLKTVDLFDVSVVAFPAYPQTKITARSVDQWATEQMEVRHGLCSPARAGRILRIRALDAPGVCR